jgi:hypothetical protein
VRLEFHVGQKVQVRGASALRGEIINTDTFGKKIVHLVRLTNDERRWFSPSDIEDVDAVTALADVLPCKHPRNRIMGNEARGYCKDCGKKLWGIG